MTWHLMVAMVVVFAVALAVVGIALAQQQTTALWNSLIGQAQGRARFVRNTTRKQFRQDVTDALRRLANDRRTHADRPMDPGVDLPRWIDGLYVWDGVKSTPLQPAVTAPSGWLNLLETALHGRPLDRPLELDSDQCEMLYRSIGDVPVAIAYLRATDNQGRSVFYAARIDPIRFKTDLLEPQLAIDDGLEIVWARTTSSAGSPPADTVLGYWAVVPTDAFMQEQRNIVIVQTFASFGLTLLALVAVLAAMWFLVRLARRDFALAQLRSNFVADVSHELRTPLALIRLFGETLQSGRVGSEEKKQEYYEIITRESTRLANLINNILDFARIDAGRKEYRLQPTDVGQVVKETYNAYAPELDHGGFEHQLILAPDLPPVDADADAISQVLVNLIGNALKYSAHERFLTIEVTRDTRRGSPGVLIAVRDRGIGIRPEDRLHLFDGFFRASDDRVREQGGAGLGLALVKHIVDAHNGSVDVESRLVKGTTFRVFLPASEQPEERALNAGSRGARKGQPQQGER